MQKIRIYGFAPSTYTQTARLVAAELDVAAELCPLEFKQPSHFERHPFGKMPAFEHGDVRLFETLAIAAYLIEAFPTSGGPELLPRAPADRARVLQWVSVAVDYAYEDLVNGLHADEPETEQRTAAAEQAQAALVLRDVLGLGNDEAARALGVSRSVLRHRLAAARSSMTETYEGLCALVNKQGACWQCSGLREASPEGHRGDPVPEHIDWDERVRLVQEATGVTGKTTPLHDVFFRHTEEQERDRLEADVTKARCGRPDSE